MNDAHMQNVVYAWTNEGKHPDYHRMAQRRLRLEWPVLAGALDALVVDKTPTIAQKRHAMLSLNPTEKWKAKIQEMSPEQLSDMYNRLPPKHKL